MPNKANKKKFFKPEDLEEAKKKHSLVLVEFFSSRSQSCEKMIPVMDEISKEFSSDLFFSRLIIDEFPEVIPQYQIAAVPTFKCFLHEKEIFSCSGVLPLEYLKNQIRDSVAKQQPDLIIENSINSELSPDSSKKKEA